MTRANGESNHTHMYQPTETEILGLWPRLQPNAPWYEFYAAARTLLRDVPNRFGFNGQWIIVDRSATHVVDATGQPPTCTCDLYNDLSQCMLAPRGSYQPIRHCAGTLAFVAYRRILAEHFTNLGPSSRPAGIKVTFWQGAYQPLTPEGVYEFAVWLANHKGKPISILAPYRKELYA